MGLRERVRLLEGEMKYQDEKRYQLREKIYELEAKIDRLMDHLKLREVKQPKVKIEPYNETQWSATIVGLTNNGPSVEE